MAAGAAGRLGQQAFVVALQPEKGLRVATDDFHQATPAVHIQLGRTGSLAHELKCGFEFTGVGFEAFTIEGITTGQVLLEQLGGPLTKACALLRVDPVTDRQHRIKIEEFDLIDFSVGGSCCIFCNNCIALQLIVTKYIAQMAGDNGFISREKLSHLLQAQPHGVLLNGNADSAAFAFVDCDLAAHGFPP